MSKPKVLVTLKNIPGNGLNLLKEKLVLERIKTSILHASPLHLFIYFCIFVLDLMLNYLIPTKVLVKIF